ncbi:unnamed protein product [Peronospora effusa]|nr:unnamed protein product [Peronospora farinosa]CAI5707027.1 unnamed protein product [Peronospora effusa]CAI5734368.1 unnamed protein product [Peronospora farinosa]
MRIRTLDVFLATLYMMTTTFVSSDDMATDSRGDGKETVAQLLANVQAAVADDEALANMFDITNASQMSEEELTKVLQNILPVSLSDSSLNSLSDSMEPTKDASAAVDTVSGALTASLSVTMVVLISVAALFASL